MTNQKTSQLAASRARKFCDEDGILPAIEAAMARGAVQGYATAHDYLNAALEGETPDRIEAFGWQLCQNEPACERRGRCLRHIVP